VGGFRVDRCYCINLFALTVSKSRSRRVQKKPVDLFVVEMGNSETKEPVVEAHTAGNTVLKVRKPLQRFTIQD